MSDPPPVRVEPAPQPLPEQWARAVANSIAERLLRPWDTFTARETMHPTGSPSGHRYAVASFPTQLPSTYVIERQVSIDGLVEPIPQLDIPYISWQLTQLDLAAGLHAAQLIEHQELLNAWNRARRGMARPPAPFVLGTNRHGRPALRRNVRYDVPELVTSMLLVGARAATAGVPDPLDVADHLARYDTISLASVLRAARD